MKVFVTGITAVAMAVALAACGGGSSSTGADHADKHANDNASCTNTVKKEGVEKVTVWAWYPAMEKVVDHFNDTHDDVQVCWNIGGQGGPEYTKFQQMIKAGTGAPDVIQLEYEAMPQFVVGKTSHILDLSKYGMNDHKADYSEGAWNSVTLGSDSSVYAVPVDTGPFIMYVRQDVFDKYKVKVPTTWDEFEQAGKDLKAAGYTGFLCDYPPNATSFNISLFAQAGAKVYDYSASDPTKVGINLTDPGVQKVLSYWQNLVNEGLVDTTDANTTDWTNNLVDGNYATYIQASWVIGYLTGLNDEQTQNFRVYETPKWDASSPEENQGGSAFSVTDQAKDYKASVEVARELFGDTEAQQIGVTDGGLFPAWSDMLNSQDFLNQENPGLGGQKANQILVPIAQGWKGDEFLPFQTWAYDTQQKTISAIIKDGGDVNSNLATLNTTIQDYAKQQGFTVQ
jgi:multiple sugar transport system substrate-binding protein